MARSIAIFALAVAIILPAADFAQQDVPPPPENPAAGQGQIAPPSHGPIVRIKVGPNVQAADLIHEVTPKYPEDAKSQHISGDVVLHAIIAKDDSVKELKLISGHPLLVNAATDAIKQWMYKPTLLNGEPVEVDTTISVVFALGADAPSATSSDDKPIDPQLKADILHLLQTMKGLEAAEAGIRSTFESLRPQLEAALPRTPNREKVIDAYEEKLVALVRQPEFQDGIVAIYAKHLSDDDIKAIDQFYQTPAGQHFVTQLPIIVNESSALGQQAATDGIPRILGELCQEFPELKGQTDFCPGEKDKQSRLMPPLTPPLSRPSPSAASEGN
jgi:TonB family protein